MNRHCLDYDYKVLRTNRAESFGTIIFFSYICRQNYELFTKHERKSMMKKLSFLAIALLLTLVGRAANELVELPSGVEPEEYTLEIIHDLMEGGIKNKKMTAMVAFSGNDVYLQGLAYYFPEAYVKGTLNDGKVTIEAGQYLGEDQYGAEYLMGFIVEEGSMMKRDILFDYDAATRNLTLDSSVNVAEISAPDGEGAVNIYTYVTSAKYTPGGLPPLVPVDVPEGLKTMPYLLSAMRNMNIQNDQGEYETITEKYNVPVNVGLNGDDLYIQGLVENVSDYWTKGTKNQNGKYVIPKGQYIGTQIIYGQRFDYFLSAIGRTSTSDITLNYNAETGAITTSQTIAATGTADQGDAYYTLNNTRIQKVEEREATPAQPEIALYMEGSPYGSTTWYYAELFVSLMDTEDKPMLSEKVSYVFLADKGDDNITPVTFKAGSKYYYTLQEDITEIPYSFTDKLDISRHTVYFEKQGLDELKTWKRLGLQTIYRGNGVEKRSEIAWQDVAEGWGITGISTVRNDDTNGKKAVYNLAGQRVDNPTKGLYIVNGKKVLVK